MDGIGPQKRKLCFPLETLRASRTQKIGKNFKKCRFFLTMRGGRLISKFGVNFLRMSASSELEPHPSCLGERCSHLTAIPASDPRSAGADRGPIRYSLLEVRAGGNGLGGCATG